MNSLAMRVIWRVLLILVVIAGPSAVIIRDGLIPLWLNALAVVGIAFAFGGMFLDWPRSAKFFTREIVGQAQLHFLALQGFRLFIILGAAQAIHIRTMGHSLGFIDSAASIVIRVLGDLTTVFLFVTAGRFEDSLPLNRIGKAGIIVTIVVVAMFLIASCDRQGLFTGEPEQVIVTPQGVRP